MLIVFITALSYEVTSEATGKAIVIMSPADGALSRGASVDVVFELHNRGARGDHINLYLDGRIVKPLRGEHTIAIKLATKYHGIPDAQNSVTVEVKQDAKKRRLRGRRY